MNEDRFMFDIQTAKITMDERGLCINSEYEPELYDKIDEFNKVQKERSSDLLFSKPRLNATLENIL